MKKNKFSVIKINGFKGMALVMFLIGCFAAGFVIFPGWLCMQAWNFIAGYFSAMPQMSLIHGAILWAILALSFYALNSDVFSISFGTSIPQPANEEKIKEIIKQINERNAKFLSSQIKNDMINETEQNEDDKVER